MTRRAAEAGFEQFLDETMTAVRREFSVERALGGTGLGPGGKVVDRLRSNSEALERRVVEPEFDAYAERSLDQFRVVLDYAESDEPIDAFREALLARDGYVEALDPAATATAEVAVRDAVVDRLRRLGDGIAPVVRRPEDEFWPAAEAAYDHAAATALVEEAFPFTGPLRSHRRQFAFEVRIDPGEVLGGPFSAALPSVTVDYTDEAIRAMTRAERQVVGDLTEAVDERFEPAG